MYLISTRDTNLVHYTQLKIQNQTIFTDRSICRSIYTPWLHPVVEYISSHMALPAATARNMTQHIRASKFQKTIATESTPLNIVSLHKSPHRFDSSHFRDYSSASHHVLAKSAAFPMRKIHRRKEKRKKKLATQPSYSRISASRTARR